MSIPKAIAIQLLNISQVILSNIEMGHKTEAIFGCLGMASIIDAETDRSDEVEKWRAAAAGTLYS